MLARVCLDFEEPLFCRLPLLFTAAFASPRDILGWQMDEQKIYDDIERHSQKATSKRGLGFAGSKSRSRSPTRRRTSRSRSPDNSRSRRKRSRSRSRSRHRTRSRSRSRSSQRTSRRRSRSSSRERDRRSRTAEHPKFEGYVSAAATAVRDKLRKPKDSQSAAQRVQASISASISKAGEYCSSLARHHGDTVSSVQGCRAEHAEVPQSGGKEAV